MDSNSRSPPRLRWRAMARSMSHYFSDLLRVLAWPEAVAPPIWVFSDLRLLERGKVVQLADMDLS